MFPNISFAMEETVAQPSPPVFIGLTHEESLLLCELEDHARTTAPNLAEALMARIQPFAGTYNISPMSDIELRLYLQKWFIQLFDCWQTPYLESPASNHRLDQIVLLTGIDIILAYAEETIKNSPNSKKATEALHKALALKITNEQLQSQTATAQHLYEMMLLD